MDALEMGLKASANVAKEVVKAFDNGLLGVKRFNFKSKPATTIEQSKRMIALGLKKETADIRGVEGIEHTPTYAWSLHRLLSMLPNNAPKIYWVLDGASISIEFEDDGADFFPHKGDIYKGVVDCIEWLIKEGYFNKEYLEE